jgi:parvulin-like peptidyl-prolyl isomerase
MLESVRSFLSGKTLFVLVTLLAIPFVFFGSTSFGTIFTSYGTVNGEAVTQTDVNLAASNVTQRYQSIFGEDFSIDTIGEEQYSESLLQEIINQKVLFSAAKKAGLGASDKQAKKEIIKIENFQSENGQFDEALFQSIIRANGFTPDDYINLIKQTVSIDFFIQGLVNSAYANEQDVRKFLIAFEKTRDLDFVLLEFDSIKNSQDVSDEEVKAFFDANPLLFLDDERRSLQFVTLNAEAFALGIEADDALIKTAYDEYLAEQESNVQRRASHIMLDVINYDSKEDALNKLISIKSQLDEGSLDFSDAVTQFSEDDATVDSSGDLGYSAGFAFPNEFETALGGMAINATSNIIDLEDTLHILKLTELIEPEIKSFEESANELKAEFIASESSLRLQSAISEYEERILAGESFASIFGEDNFTTLELLSSAELSNTVSANLANEVFNSNSSPNAVFFVEGDAEVTFFTVTEIVEPQLLSFEAAASSAKDELLNSKAQSEIASISSKFSENGLDESIADFQSYKAVSRYSSLLPREVLNTVFQADLQELKQTSLANGDVYWFKPTNETFPDEALMNEKEASYQLIVNQIQQQRYNVYLDSLLRDGLRVNLKNL